MVALAVLVAGVVAHTLRRLITTPSVALVAGVVARTLRRLIIGGVQGSGLFNFIVEIPKVCVCGGVMGLEGLDKVEGGDTCPGCILVVHVHGHTTLARRESLRVRVRVRVRARVHVRACVPWLSAPLVFR